MAKLPALQALLNLIASLLIVAGYINIRRGDRGRHRLLMIAALTVSALFLISYLYYHSQVGYLPFAGVGIIRPIYFTVLATHVILAALMVPIVLVTVALAAVGRHSLHKRVARWTLPIWLYVSLTGVLVFLMVSNIG